ncbi:MAG: PAS domain S-box protein [Chthoniobacter sp.]|nr:PAS domain S-box protein [Chthoniobacter sp.]
MFPPSKKNSSSRQALPDVGQPEPVGAPAALPDFDLMSAAEIRRQMRELQTRQRELESEIETLRGRVAEDTTELHESVRMAGAVLDALSAHIAIVDTDGRILTVNKRWRQFAVENGANLSVVCENSNYLEACDVAASRELTPGPSFAASIRLVLAGRLAEFVAEYPCHAPGGERWFIMRVTPFPGEGPRRVVISHEDISARKRAERELENSERRERERAAELEALLNAVPTPVFIAHDRECRHITGNRAAEELLRLPRHAEASLTASKETRPRHFKAFKDGRELPLADLPAQRAARGIAVRGIAVRGIAVREFEFSLVFDDGTTREILAYGRPLWDDDWRPRGAVNVLVDITERKYAELTLRASEAQLYSFVQHAPVAIAMLDREMNYLATSARWNTAFGRGHRDLVGLNHYAVHPDLPEWWKSVHQRGQAGETLAHEEELWVQADGSKVWLRWSVCPWRDAQRKIGGIIIMTEDITARKTAEEALREQENRYRVLVESSPDAIFVNWRNRIEYINAAGLTLFGATDPAQVVGKSPYDFFHADCHEIIRERIAGLLAGGNVTPTIEEKLVRLNGEVRFVEVVAATIPQHGDRAIQVVVRDITERKQAEEALRRRKEQLRSILNTVVDAIITIDRAGLITSLNPATERLFGYTEGEMIGHNVSLLMPSPYREEHDRYLEDYHRSGQPRVIGIGREVEGRRKDGSTFPIELTVSEVDHMHIFTGVVRDITERKRLEGEVLGISEQERLRVAADLHDGICQELVGIQFLSIALCRDLEASRNPLARQARRIAKAILAATQHTRETARGMNPVVADGDGLMHAFRRLARTTARTHRLMCLFRCPVPVSIENPRTANELYRIAQEAIHNALRHGKAKRITLRLSGTEDALCLTVMDNGCGLPADVSHTPGMGLRVMRYRAGLIGGQLVVQSRRRGGTEVICRVVNAATKR